MKYLKYAGNGVILINRTFTSNKKCSLIIKNNNVYLVVDGIECSSLSINKSLYNKDIETTLQGCIEKLLKDNFNIELEDKTYLLDILLELEGE